MARGNGFAKGFQTLERHFGERNFRVRNMDDDMVFQLAAQIGYPNERSSIGRWLTSMDDNAYTVEDGRLLELIVVEYADGSKPGIYRMRTVAIETPSHHEETAGGTRLRDRVAQPCHTYWDFLRSWHALTIRRKR